MKEEGLGFGRESNDFKLFACTEFSKNGFPDIAMADSWRVTEGTAAVALIAGRRSL